MSGEAKPWYTAGLRFACTGCGDCCRAEGVVWVERREIRAIARFLGLDRAAFAERFLRRFGRRLSLTEKPDHACVFWDRGSGLPGCTIYQVRPGQCRTYPFWSRYLESPAAWRREAGECEGIGEGDLYSRAEIEALRHRRSATRAPGES